MGVCINYDDEITIALTEPNAYGTEQVVEQAQVMAAIDLSTGYTHGGNQDAVTSDATVFISATEQFAIDNYNRLEECLVIIDLFGTPETRAWYKVVQVNVARDTQLCNDIDHLELSLKKTAEVYDVS
jgi:hypothetical protein